MGSPPLWYRIVRASKFLGVSPWDLEARPFTYLLQAEAAQSAEASARKAAEQQKGRGRQRGASRTR